MSDEQRILALDGIRGVVTVAVVASHFLAEVPHGCDAFAVGSIAVDIFFVLSGFLIGRVILTRRAAANFFQVFYARRFLRTIPSYLVTVLAVFGLTLIAPPDWLGDTKPLPAWTYLTFVQNFFIASTGSTGLEWLKPTWSLAVEEQFYLVAPAALVVLPRRMVLPAMLAVFIGSGAYRLYVAASGAAAVEFLPLLLARADALAAGVAAGAVWMQLNGTKRYDRLLEVLPLAAMLMLLAIGAFSAESWPLTWFHTLAALGAAAFILRAALSPEATPWLEARWLQFFARNSYSIYLVHMPVAGLTHGLLLGARPDIENLLQLGVTGLASLFTLLVARALTANVEKPLTAIGRKLRWRDATPKTACSNGSGAGLDDVAKQAAYSGPRVAVLTASPRVAR